jgi:hypothetical protein
MITLLLLFLPLAAALLVYLAGDKTASKLALGFAVIELAVSGWALSKFVHEALKLFTSTSHGSQCPMSVSISEWMD